MVGILVSNLGPGPFSGAMYLFTRQAKIAMDQMQATGLGNVWEAHERDGFSHGTQPGLPGFGMDVK